MYIVYNIHVVVSNSKIRKSMFRIDEKMGWTQ